MAARTRSRKRHAKPKADLTTLPEENPSPVLRVDHAARVIYANSAAKRLLGVESDNGSKLPADLAATLRSAVAKGRSAGAQLAAEGRDYALSIVPVEDAGYVNIYGRDITDELRAQREMADLARFPEENPNPVLRVGFDGELLFANKGAKAVKGLVVDKGRRIAAELARAIEDAIAQGRYSLAEIRFDGRLFAFAMTPIADAGYVNAYGRDITEQWEAQQRAEDLAKFPEENPNPVFRVDAAGKVLYANRPARTLPGLLTHKAKRLAGALAPALAEAVRNERTEVADVRSGDRLFAIALTPVAGAGYLNAYGRDVTEERHALREIIRIKTFNENILETLTNGILTLDSRLTVTSANRAMRAFLGLPETETGTAEGRALAALLDGRNPWLLEVARDSLGTREPRSLLDQELRGRDGRGHSVNLTVAPFHDGNGDQSGLILAFEDISREKRVKGTMVRFMSDKVVERLLELDETALSGTTQEVTVLFSDIREFASLSERLGAQEMVRILNAYFSDMVDIIFESGGTLDKFIGDALMAVFGAPFQSHQDTENSIAAASEMLRRLRPFNAARRAEGIRPIDIGVGIDTGTVIAGTIGSPRRMDYTVIGEHVNLASRIESVNKLYGTHILISEDTRAKLSDGHRMREVDLVRVAGIDGPVRLYEVLDYHTEETFPKMERVLAVFAEGLAAYRARRWKEGATAFAEALNANPHDRPTQIFLSRCWNHLARPPGESWSGITDLTR